MRRVALLLALLVAAASAVPVVNAARAPGIVILVDLAHGQPAGGLDVMMDMIPEAEWILLVPSEDYVASLPKNIVAKASEIRVGGFTPDNLAGVDVVIIGQVTQPLAPEEVQAIVDWFNAEGAPRLIWVAGDSDYPAQGSETAQLTKNQVLEALGSKIRADYVSVEDEQSYAGKTYRVVGIVNPDPEVAVLACGAEKMLFHGPGPLYALDENGNPVNPVETKVPGVYVVVTTTDKGKIVQHQSAESGGMDPVFYTNIGEYGVYPLLLVEDKTGEDGVPKRIIASGETPYGGYQAGVTWEYHGVIMQGPILFRNLIYWGTGYMGDLLSCQKLMEAYNKAEEAYAKAEDNAGKVTQLQQTLSDLSKKVDQLSQNLTQVSQKADEAYKKAEEAAQKGPGGAAYAGIGLAIIALIVAAAAFAKK